MISAGKVKRPLPKKKEEPKFEQTLLIKMRDIRHQLILPNITAESWCIWDIDSGGSLVHGKRYDQRREVASLTKMMTFVVSWNLLLNECPESSP